MIEVRFLRGCMPSNRQCNSLILILLLILISVSISTSVSASNDTDKYLFDPAFLKGSSLNIDLGMFNDDITNIPIGIYVVDLYLNGRLIKNQVKIKFVYTENTQQDVEPCLYNNVINLLPLKEQKQFPHNDNECVPFNDFSSNSSWEFNKSNLNLNVYLPQAELKKEPRGFIPTEVWDEGITALFIKHNTNYYESKQNNTTKYLWSSVNSGINFGLWQFRNVSNLNYRSSSNSSGVYKYDNVRTYVLRPISSLNSTISAGSITTSSSFGSLYFNGVKLSNDKRMRSQSMQGYAPEVRGVANSNAKVTIKQMDKIIYENVVPPGPFIIDDLNNTRSSSDYYVTVTEADGTINSFIVPYSSVPNSVRAGEFNYEFSIGEVRDFDDSQFIDFAFDRGMSNAITINTGVRVAKNYGSILFGGVVSGDFGAFGVNTSISQTKLKGDTTYGFMEDVSYSKSFESGTDIMLAAYRYSSENFRELYDYLAENNNDNYDEYNYVTLNQKNRFTFNVSQKLSDFGSLSFNTSAVNYYNGKNKEFEYQMSYSNSIDSIYYSINAARQTTLTGYYDNKYTELSTSKKENVISATVSIPFYDIKNVSAVSLNYSNSKDSSSLNTSVSGNIQGANNVSYSLYAGNTKQKNNADSNTYGASLNTLTSMGSYRASAANANHYTQYSIGTSGTLVIHSEGLTYGPYVGDTFALVKADGAVGAELNNANGAQINRFGYAISPSLTPYRYNNIGLNPDGMNNKTDLEGGE